MNKNITLLIGIIIIDLILCYSGYVIGVRRTYEKFVLKECWVDSNKANVVCDTYDIK